MKQSIFILTLLNLFGYTITGQTIIETQTDLSKYSKLGKEEKVYYLEMDSAQIDTLSVMSINKSLIIGKCNNWDEMSCGIINLSLYAENVARAKGYNAVSTSNYRGTEKKDTLDVTFYRLISPKITNTQLSDTLKELYLINPKLNADKDAKINSEKVNLKSGSFIKKEVNSEYVTIKLGGGLLSSSAQLDFTKSNKRYFIINGYQMAGASRGVGIGVSSPTIMEVGEVTGRIIMKYLSNK